MHSHLICLSRAFLEEEFEATGKTQLVPFEGSCKTCHSVLKWGVLIQKMKTRKSSSLGSQIDTDAIEEGDVFYDAQCESDDDDFDLIVKPCDSGKIIVISSDDEGPALSRSLSNLRL